MWIDAGLMLCGSLAGTIALLFGAAGRFDLPFFWAYVGAMLVCGLAVIVVIDRDLLAERLRPGSGGSDRGLSALLAVAFGVHVVVAGLDARHGWSHVPIAGRAVGFCGALAGMSLTIWSMRVNRFFSPYVRLQSDRGHRLVTGGPYRFVRHPGYAGALCVCIFSGFALGSWSSLAPSVFGVALILRRVVLEDRFLRGSLDDYHAYSQRVRWWFVPGIF